MQWRRALGVVAGAALALAPAAPALADPSPVTEVIAHRGYSAAYPEDTLLALAEAVRAGATTLEMDVRFSRDGVPFLMHDATVDRVTNGTGRTGALTWAAISRLEVDIVPARPTPVSRLDAALWLVKVAGVRAIIEPKDELGPRQLGALARLVRHFGAGRITVESFSPATLRHLRAIDAGLATALITTRCTEALGASTSTVLLEWQEATPLCVAALQARGRRVLAWTADAATAWEDLRAAGVDGILTDDPPALRAWLAVS